MLVFIPFFSYIILKSWVFQEKNNVRNIIWTVPNQRVLNKKKKKNEQILIQITGISYFLIKNTPKVGKQKLWLLLFDWYPSESIFVFHLVKLATVVEGNQKAPFSIAIHRGVAEGATPFPGLLHFTLDSYFILLSVKQGGIKYHF